MLFNTFAMINIQFIFVAFSSSVTGLNVKKSVKVRFTEFDYYN